MIGNVGYGALYLDHGEGMTQAQIELTDLIAVPPGLECLFYDVIAGPRQERLLDKYVQQVDALARSLLPEGTPVAVAGSVAQSPNDDGPRPMRTAMIAAVEQGLKQRD